MTTRHGVLDEQGRAWGRSFLAWRAAPDLWITFLWGSPTVDEVEALARAYEVAATQRERFVAYLDASRMVGAEPAAFQRLAGYMAGRAEAFHARVERQALLRPTGFVGAVVTGFFDAIGYTLPTRAFLDRRRALEWLLGARRGRSMAREVEALIAERVDASPALARLRAWLDRHLDQSPAQAARALHLSARTLQRQLHAAGTSYLREQRGARIRRAEQLLRDTELKVTAIALEVGFSSAQHFARVFRAATGSAPSALRRDPQLRGKLR